MSLSRSLRLIALTLFTAVSFILSTHGSAPLLRQPLQLHSGVNASFAHPECFAQQNVSKDKGQAAQAAAASCATQQTSPEERAKIGYLIDSKIEGIYDQFMRDEGLGFTTQCVACEWLPGYFIKKNTSRIDGAQALKECIEKHQLNLLTVPEKWIHEIPVHYKDNGYRNLVIAKKIQETNKHADTKIINLEQAKQLCILLKHAQYGNRYYADTHSENLLHCDDGRIGLIDTESSGWSKDNKKGLNNLLHYKIELSKDAQAFVERKIRKTKSRDN